jgi:hypothetical protein
MGGTADAATVRGGTTVGVATLEGVDADVGVITRIGEPGGTGVGIGVEVEVATGRVTVGDTAATVGLEEITVGAIAVVGVDGEAQPAKIITDTMTSASPREGIILISRKTMVGTAVLRALLPTRTRGKANFV